MERGKLKIFMGYAAGVGKTYMMLEQGQELKARGVDVVIGYFEPHARKDTIAKTEWPGNDSQEELRLSRIRLRRDGHETRSWHGIHRSAWWMNIRTPMSDASVRNVGRMCRCCSTPALTF